MKLGLCILGCGRFASTFAQEMVPLSDEIDLYFASRDSSKAEDYSRRFHGVGSFGSYQAAAADSRVEAFYMCTPHHLHREHVALAAQAIKLGDAAVVVAGGIESMSRAPYLLPNARSGYRMGHGELVDSMINDGLHDCMIDCHMGQTAEHLAEIYGINREDVDLYAMESQARTKMATEQGFFAQEIVPVTVSQGRGEVLVDTDEHPRPGVTMERLAELKPAFQKAGIVTAGNSAGINDGASAVVSPGFGSSAMKRCCHPEEKPGSRPTRVRPCATRTRSRGRE